MALILVAEDEIYIFKLVSFRLEHQGHQVCWAQHGGEVLELARTKQPDLILLDVMMPVMDGFQVLQQLKSDDEVRHIPVIMLTSRGHAPDLAAGLAGGAVDYVVKPFDFGDLLRRVNAAIAGKG